MVLTAGLLPLSIVPLGFWIRLDPFYSGGARDPESEQALPDARRDGHSFSPKIIFVGLTLVTGFLMPYLLVRLFLMLKSLEACSSFIQMHSSIPGQDLFPTGDELGYAMGSNGSDNW